MRWRGRRQSTNVRDARGQGGGGFGLPGGFGMPRGRGPAIRIPAGGRGRSGGMGCGTLIVIGVVLWMLGINPLTLLGSLGGGLGGGLGPSVVPNRPAPQTQNQSGTQRKDEMTQFIRTILASTEDVWAGIMKSYGK
ncbi:MAG: neutral zinc metallopeptidase, partial [Pseudomonadota bacterium]|nr:neutral zinc metallopeptidase [Pseudomonadota bacterium]MEC9368837.1 neutral zinc metallopeptidase [Pseudomonadota bacterium]